MFYWISAAGLWVFGPHEWTARLAPILGATVGIAAVYLWVRQRQHAQTARWFLLLALVQPLIFGGAEYANLDMLVAGMITATIVLLVESVLRLHSGQPYRCLLVWAYAFAGLGFLAKGLIGLVLPALVLLCWLAATRQLKYLPALLQTLCGWLVLAVLTLPWLIVMQTRYPDFFNYFFIVQHLERFAKTGFNNAHPWWFYIAILSLFMLPFAWPLWRSLRAGSLKPATAHAHMRWLMCLWALVIALFFSLPKSKLVGYVLPAVFPLVYLAADALVLWWQSSGAGGRKYYAYGMAGAFACVCMGAALVSVFHLSQVRDERPLGWFLAQHYRAGDEVVMMSQYYFSLPFYARLEQPVRMVDNWRSPEIQNTDNWKKEIADAAQFDAVVARQTLLLPEQWAQSLCRASGIWLLAPLSAAQSYPQLQNQQPVFTYRQQGIWYQQPAQMAACR